MNKNYKKFIERKMLLDLTCNKLREGQNAFNALWDTFPKLADQIRGTEIDPFYSDKKVGFFLLYVKHFLEEA